MRTLSMSLIVCIAAGLSGARAQEAAPPAAGKALRDRVTAFYQLAVDKKYRQAEAMVADESKDAYYNLPKREMTEFRIEKLAIDKGGQTAQVTIRTKTTILMMGAGNQIFDIAVLSTWKIENGVWAWYIDPKLYMMSPMGPVSSNQVPPGPDKPATAPDLPPAVSALKENAPTIASLQGLVQVDRKELALIKGGAADSVTITDGLPGGLDLSYDEAGAKMRGLIVEIPKKHLEAGEKSSVKISAGFGAQEKGVVRIFAAPLNLEFDIQVRVSAK